uniref:Uncharacterized protein n=1 Tax=Arundo donax TaxID=35708 RepID=A0A0A9GWY0_ARUDO
MISLSYFRFIPQDLGFSKEIHGY